MLEVKNLRKNFENLRAVDDISFNIAKGEVVGLLGPNGAGKTTTMRLITGFLKPDGGNILINGVPVSENASETKNWIGYLPENAPSYHDMEVTEFLDYAAALRKVPAADRKNDVKETIELCGLAGVVGRPIGQLSRGYKQRVCLGQAIIHKPPLLIMDEPTTGLDPHQIQEIRTLIKEIGKERTVILSTHIMQEVQAVCQRALIIAKGKLVGEGTLEALMQQGRGKTRYFAKIRAARGDIEKRIVDLSELTVEKWGAENGAWQTLILQSDQREDLSETIFSWVVANRWSLSELKKEATSLEEIFLELTRQ